MEDFTFKPFNLNILRGDQAYHRPQPQQTKDFIESISKKMWGGTGAEKPGTTGDSPMNGKCREQLRSGKVQPNWS
jgi:hypothetical protein